MTTLLEITEEVREQLPACSSKKVKGVLARLKIAPLGEIKQRPQHYPGDAATRVKVALGLATNGNGEHDDGKIVSEKRLRSERKKARGK